MTQYDNRPNGNNHGQSDNRAIKNAKSDQANLAVSARNITLSLGKNAARVDILHDLSLDIVEKSSLAILGASGSGKSSLMAVLTGLEKANSGDITIAGRNFGNLSEDELAMARRGHIGIVLQSFHLLPTMTALENVAIPLELSAGKNAFDRAEEELIAVGLADRIHHYPAQLSGGEQQRVAIARAMATRPEIIFADEPTGNLDEKTGAQIISLLFERKQANDATLVMITHDRQLAKQCDRIIEMRDGRILSDSAA